MNRYANLQRIQQLDPQRDCIEICGLIAGWEFPWDVTRALEIALLRTFCVTSIAKLLDRTGEFQHRTQKRYDDTGLIIAEILKWGYDSPRGAAALGRMNAIHSHFPISNEDYLYVLSTFIYDPVRWIERFGWRPFCEQEKLASFYFWQAVGERMNIQNIPPSYESFQEYNLEWERQNFCYAEPNQRVADATLKMLLGWFPAPLRPAIAPCVHAILDEGMLDALGWPHPSPQLRQAVELILRMRGRVLRWFPPRQTPEFFTDLPSRSYPQGYELADLGPPHLLGELNQGLEEK